MTKARQPDTALSNAFFTPYTRHHSPPFRAWLEFAPGSHVDPRDTEYSPGWSNKRDGSVRITALSVYQGQALAFDYPGEKHTGTFNRNIIRVLRDKPLQFNSKSETKFKATCYIFYGLRFDITVTSDIKLYSPCLMTFTVKFRLHKVHGLKFWLFTFVTKGLR